MQHEVQSTPDIKTPNIDNDGLRHDWSRAEISDLFDVPLMDLIFQAQTVHRQHFPANEVQVSSLLSIKTGGCPEDCAYCPQSSHHNTGLPAAKLLQVQTVLEEAQRAKNGGATRFCMGGAWRSPKDRDMDVITAMIEGVNAMGMETCMTLGMLSPSQTIRLKEAGLDYYNHNVDSSPEYYEKIITTRTYEDRLNTLALVRDAGINVCSGGIVGMGETANDRTGMIQTLANLPEHPGSVPINMLVHVEGTPLNKTEPLDNFDFIRTIAVSKLTMPASVVRLSAGRLEMSDEMQAMCFMAGASSIFAGSKLLTTENPDQKTDMELFERMGLKPSAICKKEHQKAS
ncbi:MAG: biotin synthase BioB [Sneathiella sp.]